MAAWTVYVDLYKLAVEMADRVSARRTAANNFFLALNTALTPVIGIFIGAGSSSPTYSNANPLPTTIACVGGVALCVAWWLVLRSYRDLNRAKFAVITDMEGRMPVQLFHQEWKYLRGDSVEGWRKRYSEQGTVERIVPFVFGSVYLVTLLSAIIP